MRGQWLLDHTHALQPPLDISWWSNVFRLWKHEANPNGVIRSTVWDIYRERLEEPPQVWLREAVWDKYADLHLHHLAYCEQYEMTDEPGLTVRDVMIPPGTLATIQKWADDLVVPVGCTLRSVDSHPTEYGVQFMFHPGQTRLQWWNDGPVEWQSFIEATNRIRLYFKKCLNHGDTSSHRK